VSDECIHGFVDGLCATCNPKPVAEVPAAARPAARSRIAAPPRATVRSLRAAARVPVGSAPADTLLEQRIYHVTHVTNLAGIRDRRAIVAGAEPTLDLSPAQLRDERRQIPIPGVSGSLGTDATLADFVPFFLSPDAALWQSLRAGLDHPRLSPGARAADPLEFVFLVSTVRHVVAVDRAFVIADRNVEGATTRFATTREDAERMLYRLRADADGSQLVEAELLVAEALPFESVTLVGVANDRVRQSVRDLLAGSDFTPKISVYPPWFQTSE
jgi:ssDNA thymidine ADP-ribosyltransferase, DarT